MRVIGINGLKTSGKDATYHIIADTISGVRRIAFADKLKLLGAKIIGIEDRNDGLMEQMDYCKKGWLFEVWDLSRGGCLEAPITEFDGRKYLQSLGFHARELFGENFWIDQILPTKSDELAARYPDTHTLIITDVRYPNEAQRVQQLGGEIWHIVRPGLQSDGHSSEQPLSPLLIDRVINNDGTLEDLENLVQSAILVS